MNQYPRNHLLHFLVLAGTLVSIVGCGEQHPTEPVGSHEAAATEDFERGPHNGRLLRDGDLAIEITIFETGVPPEFRVFPYRNEQPIDPATVELTIELGRLGDRIDRFAFTPQAD